MPAKNQYQKPGKICTVEADDFLHPRAYRKVKAYTPHPNLSVIFETATEWRKDQFAAVLKWVEGMPLSDLAGILPLYCEDLGEDAHEKVVGRWIRELCRGLEVLHRQRLVHGDVSPKNIIVSGGDVVLTDYDFVASIGEPAGGQGVVTFTSPEAQRGRMADPSDDIYALAASFFFALFEREPFRYGGMIEKRRGLNWEETDRRSLGSLADFLDRATHHDSTQRFTDGAAAQKFFEATREDVTQALPTQEVLSAENAVLHQEEVPWLKEVLQAYPGSPWGNAETRGLDSDFAKRTYVETKLEAILFDEIDQGHVHLVILCGNAGDGKTALLQHLARRFGFSDCLSSKRILQHKRNDGLNIHINLDGSAACGEKSADEILDDFLRPFQKGNPTQKIARLLAVNDGRLLEWIEHVEDVEKGSTHLTDSLRRLLAGEQGGIPQHLRFINLNDRSLVGSFNPDGKTIDTEFFDRLIDNLYGGEEAEKNWRACVTCLAQERCQVFRSRRLFVAHIVSRSADDAGWPRRKLCMALQAVHLRGDVHLTVRELRAALSYILFGVHYCTELHENPDLKPFPYYDLAFDPGSLHRQGEVLRELSRLDPGLDAHPVVDRYLRGREEDTECGAPRRYPAIALTSARRRAFFEWTDEDLKRVSRDGGGLTLFGGKHIARFRDLPLKSEEECVDLCTKICRGISCIEELPAPAFQRKGVVPLKIIPRTPTETAFWVEKDLHEFSLAPELFAVSAGIDHLHRRLILACRDRNGKEERLLLGNELFHLLLDLAEGFQLADVYSDDVFANLAIFTQRLSREEARALYAWSPLADEKLWRVSIEDKTSTQKIVLSELAGRE